MSSLITFCLHGPESKVRRGTNRARQRSYNREIRIRQAGPVLIPPAESAPVRSGSASVSRQSMVTHTDPAFSRQYATIIWLGAMLTLMPVSPLSTIQGDRIRQLFSFGPATPAPSPQLGRSSPRKPAPRAPLTGVFRGSNRCLPPPNSNRLKCVSLSYHSLAIVMTNWCRWVS